jgi:hypothetical protein
MDERTIAKMQERFERFYLDMVKANPDHAYVVMYPEGATRWNFQRISAKQPINVVGTGKGGLLPVRDCHIYRVIDREPGEEPNQPDAVTTEVAQMLHRTMCGLAKLGSAVTLGEIQAAAEAQIKVRLDELESQKADIVPSMGAAEHPTEEQAKTQEDRELPRTAVQICIGDTVVSDPYDTPELAQASEEWATAHQLPEVVGQQAMVWLRPLFEDHDKKED